VRRLGPLPAQRHPREPPALVYLRPGVAGWIQRSSGGMSALRYGAKAPLNRARCALAEIRRRPRRTSSGSPHPTKSACASGNIPSAAVWALGSCRPGSRCDVRGVHPRSGRRDRSAIPQSVTDGSCRSSGTKVVCCNDGHLSISGIDASRSVDTVPNWPRRNRESTGRSSSTGSPSFLYPAIQCGDPDLPTVTTKGRAVQRVERTRAAVLSGHAADNA
jgi:hypothetical protein